MAKLCLKCMKEVVDADNLFIGDEAVEDSECSNCGERGENSKCAKCGNIKKFHPMNISDGLGHVERCDFVKCVEDEQ